MRDSASGAGGRTVRLEVPARPGYVVLARLALSAVCRLTQLGDEDVADLKLAITEAASTFVGSADDAPRPLEPVPGAGEERLRFSFELAEGELAVDIACDGRIELSNEERELSHAIISATVDRWESGEGLIHLVKHLRDPAG